MPNVTFAAGSSVSISGTPTVNIGTIPNVTIANSSLSVNVGTMPAVTIANSTLNVSLSGTNNNVTISGTPTVTVSNAINIASGTITVSSANATIVNQQVAVGQLYNASVALTIPINTSTNQFNYKFLANGVLANVHHVDFYIKSANGYVYKVVTANAFTYFADGSSFNASASWNLTNNGVNSYSSDGQAVICNNIQFTLTTTAPTAAQDSITVYFAIDAQETAIGTTDGVYVKPYNASILDNSGAITTANTAQQILTYQFGRRYLFFQNLSSSDMYIGLGVTAPTVGGSGAIWVPANGGTFTMEGSFCSADYLQVICGTATAKYTCKFY
jgi:hypothetical protein